MSKELIKNSTELKLLNSDSFTRMIEIQRNDGFDHAYYLNVERLKRLMKKGEVFYGFYLGDNLIGFIGLDIEIRARLHFLSFHEDFQGKGYATQAFIQVLDKLKLQDIRQLHAYTEVDSQVELFLEKRGFKKVGFYKNRFGDGKDANIFELKI